MKVLRDNAYRSQPIHPRRVSRPSNAGRPPFARTALTFCTALLTSLLASCSAAPDVVQGIHEMCGEGNQGLFRVTTNDEDMFDPITRRINPDAVCLAIPPPVLPGGEPRSCTLRAALNTAAVCGGSHTIELANTTYTLDHEYQPSAPLQSRDQVQNRRVGKVGLPRVFGTVTIEGHGAVIQRGRGATSLFRFFHVPPNGNLTLNDVVLRRGIAPDDGTIAAFGGAIHNEGMLVTNRVVFDSNEAMRGGALFNAGTAELSDSRWTHNRASARGAAIDQDKGSLTVTRSTFFENGRVEDGGVVSILLGTVEIEESTFSSNQGRHAGAIDAISGTLVIRRSSFRGQTGGNAGAVSCAATTVRLEDVTIAGNDARAGGGVSVGSSCAVTFSNTIFEANRPADCSFMGDREPSLEGINRDSDSSCRFSRTGERRGSSTPGGIWTNEPDSR